jgi:hypothetical protein
VIQLVTGEFLAKDNGMSFITQQLEANTENCYSNRIAKVQAKEMLTQRVLSVAEKAC